MRSGHAAAVIVLVAACNGALLAAAQTSAPNTTTTAPPGAVSECAEAFPFTSGTKNAFDARTCDEALVCAALRCACLGLGRVSNATGLCGLAPGALPSCPNVVTCQRAFVSCMDATHDVIESAEVGGNGSTRPSSACTFWATQFRLWKLQAVLGAYNGSQLHTGCRASTCAIAGNAARGDCAVVGTGANAGVVSASCDDYPLPLGLTTTTASPTAAPAPAAVVAQLVLNGTAFRSLLAKASWATQLREALRSDIAARLNVSAAQVAIVKLTVGSLVVDFTVAAASSGGVAPTAAFVQAAIGGQTDAAWMTRSQAVYSVVSDKAFAVSSASATAAETNTAAPAVTTSTTAAATGIMTTGSGGTTTAPAAANTSQPPSAPPTTMTNDATASTAPGTLITIPETTPATSEPQPPGPTPPRIYTISPGLGIAAGRGAALVAAAVGVAVAMLAAASSV